MLNILRIFISLLFIAGFIYPKDLALDGNYSSYKIMPLEGAAGFYPAANTPLCLFDGRKDTALIVRPERGRRYFKAAFSKPEEIGRIVIFGGNRMPGAEFEDFARPKNIKIYEFSKGVGKYGALLTNVILNDGPEGQVVEFDGPKTLAGLIVDVLSAYPGKKCGCSSEIYIGEIELYSGEEKYRVVNFDKALAEYKTSYRRDRLEELKGFFSMLRKAEIKADANGRLSLWGRLGVKANDIYIHKQAGLNECVMIELTFTGDDGYSGKVLAGKNGGRYKPASGEKSANYHLKEYVELGSWKIDENGVLLVQTGSGPWKACGTGGFFDGTDLGVFESVTYP